MNPKITVLMPVYNGERYLKEAIESILNQTFTDFEFLIIDDGSTDNSLNIIKQYATKDSRIRLVIHKQNKKIVPTLNEGLKLAKGKYIARMDCDDISMPARIEEEINFLENHQDYIMVGSDYIIINEFAKKLFYYAAFPNYETIKVALSVTSCFAHGSVMYKKRSVLAVNGYNSKIHDAEDFELWTRLIKIGKFANIPKPLFKYRMNYSGAFLSKLDHAIKIFRKYGKKYWNTFDKNGPAPINKWVKIWPYEVLAIKPTKSRKENFSNLHLLFALEYFKRKQILLSLKHFEAAYRIRPYSAIPWSFYIFKTLIKRIFKFQL